MTTEVLGEQVNLFGERVDRFVSALERYGIWPVTVWPVNMQDRTTQDLKDAIGDLGQGRADVGPGSRGGRKMGATYHTSLGAHENNVSIFNPQVAAHLLNLYAPSVGVCYDPFAGGGTRAIMAAKHGLSYRGVELRAEEVALTNARIAAAGLPAHAAAVYEADARNAWPLADGCADFLLTCPPYYDLEQYDGGPADLSMLGTYEAFVEQLGIVVRECKRILKPGATACWVIGLHRDKEGCLLPLHHDLAWLHAQEGFKYREEIVLHVQNSGAIQRVGSFDKGRRHLIRVHEYALVFQA